LFHRWDANDTSAKSVVELGAIRLQDRWLFRYCEFVPRIVVVVSGGQICQDPMIFHQMTQPQMR
jgi:hypothetical protein